jgi:hypothetical protein
VRGLLVVAALLLLWHGSALSIPNSVTLVRRRTNWSSANVHADSLWLARPRALLDLELRAFAPPRLDRANLADVEKYVATLAVRSNKPKRLVRIPESDRSLHFSNVGSPVEA